MLGLKASNILLGIYPTVAELHKIWTVDWTIDKTLDSIMD